MSLAATFWLSEKCVSDPRISGGAVVMLRHLNKWLRAKRQGELTMDEFIAVLNDEGYEVKEVMGVRLVIGLGSAEDWKQYFG